MLDDPDADRPGLADRWLSAAADLLLGACCPGCGGPGRGVCPSCRRQVTGHRPACTQPDPCPAGFPWTVAAGPYDPLMRRLISAHKERQVLALTGVLGDRLALAIAQLLVDRWPLDPWTGLHPGRLMLVPMPSARAAVRARGFDATGALSRRAVSRLRAAGVQEVQVGALLRPGRAVHDQAGLTAAARQLNLQGALVASRPRGPNTRAALVIVDDVVTTGASLSEARRALRAAGLEVLGAAVVAATRRRRPSTGRAHMTNP